MICKINNCPSKTIARNLCDKHYRFYKRRGLLIKYPVTMRKMGMGQITKEGYMRITIPNGERMQEHRYVIEQFLGRKLDPSEKIHHIDGNKLNNVLGNLELCTQSEHIKKHRQQLLDSRDNPDGLMFINWSTFTPPSFRKNYGKKRKCSIHKCFSSVRAWGLCQRHYTSYWFWRKRKRKS